MKKICVFGASIACGAWDFEEQGWANRLRKHIESKKGTEYLLHNLSISGDRTGLLLKRLEADLDAAEPDIVIFDVGRNDSIFIKKENKNRIEKKQFQENLKKIIRITRKYAKKIIFIGLTNVNEKKVNPWDEELGRYYYKKYIREYDEILEKFCKENNISYVKLFGLLDENKDLYDGLHPNSEGHKKLFEKVRNFLEEFRIL